MRLLFKNNYKNWFKGRATNFNYQAVEKGLISSNEYCKIIEIREKAFKMIAEINSYSKFKEFEKELQNIPAIHIKEVIREEYRMNVDCYKSCLFDEKIREFQQQRKNVSKENKELNDLVSWKEREECQAPDIFDAEFCKKVIDGYEKMKAGKDYKVFSPFEDRQCNNFSDITEPNFEQKKRFLNDSQYDYYIEYLWKYYEACLNTLLQSLKLSPPKIDELLTDKIDNNDVYLVYGTSKIKINGIANEVEKYDLYRYKRDLCFSVDELIHFLKMFNVWKKNTCKRWYRGLTKNFEYKDQVEEIHFVEYEKIKRIRNSAYVKYTSLLSHIYIDEFDYHYKETDEVFLEKILIDEIERCEQNNWTRMYIEEVMKKYSISETEAIRLLNHCKNEAKRGENFSPDFDSKFCKDVVYYYNKLMRGEDWSGFLDLMTLELEIYEEPKTDIESLYLNDDTTISLQIDAKASILYLIYLKKILEEFRKTKKLKPYDEKSKDLKEKHQKEDNNVEKPPEKLIIFRDKETIEEIHKRLKDLFPEREQDLKKVLNGENTANPLLFPGQQNVFVELFVRLKYHGRLLSGKGAISNWICKNFEFVFKIGNIKEIRKFNKSSVDDYLKEKSGTVPSRGKRLFDDWLPFITKKNRQREKEEEKE